MRGQGDKEIGGWGEIIFNESIVRSPTLTRKGSVGMNYEPGLDCPSMYFRKVETVTPPRVATK